MDEPKFEWDVSKDAENRRKHGVAFEEARTVFLDDFARLIADPGHSIGEERFLLPGMSICRRFLVVCRLDTGLGAIRVISARRANRRERKQYEDFRHA